MIRLIEMPEPRFMTERTPGAKSGLKRAGQLAVALGRPLIPWQREAIRGMTEIDPETGTFRYSRIVISTPRQVGKTTIDGMCATTNMFLGPDRRSWYTAQDGTKAREVFRGYMDQLEKSYYKPALSRLLRGNGAEMIQTIRGSEYRPFVPNAESLHSKQADRVTLDEVWTYSKAQGSAIIQAADAPMSTRLGTTGHEPQLIIMSTEGTAESEWYNPILDELREHPDPSTFFVDFGLRDDEDPTDLKTVARRHPGYGHLFNMASLKKRQATYQGDVSGFARAYGNRRQGAQDRVIPVHAWNDSRIEASIPDGLPVCIGAAIGVDDEDGAIVMSGYHPEYGKITEVMEHRPGSSWMLLRLKEIQANAGYAVPFAIPDTGPSARLHDQASRAGLNLLEGTGATANAVACAGVLAGLETGEWRFRTHPALEAAADLAARRWVQDGAWVWGRRASSGSIAALEAGTWSAYGIDHLPEDHGLQVF